MAGDAGLADGCRDSGCMPSVGVADTSCGVKAGEPVGRAGAGPDTEAGRAACTEEDIPILDDSSSIWVFTAWGNGWVGRGGGDTTHPRGLGGSWVVTHPLGAHTGGTTVRRTKTKHWMHR